VIVSSVNNNLQTLATLATIRALTSQPVRRRPVFFKDLGEFFVRLREARQWNQSQAADMARRRGLSALTRQVLLRLERGQTKNPEPDVMRAIAALYEVDYRVLVEQFVRVRFGVIRRGARVSLDADRSPPEGCPGALAALDR
jgi:transcriptional regulator with XRE-family HTH domain